MKRTFLKNSSTALAVILAVMLVFVAVFAVEGSTAMADDTLQGTKIGVHTIAHTSDIHYFPWEYCYQDITDPDYKKSDYYYSQTTSTKLVNESGNILYRNVMNMIKLAEQGKMPMYLISSGDLTKQGERVAHIDVANALRYLQNEIRKIDGYENFQVLVTIGNHDIANWEGELYDQTTGEALTAESVTLAQFAMIYNGLGFPSFDMSILSQIYGEDYFESVYSEYIPSSLSTELDFEYLNESLNLIYDMSKSGSVDVEELAIAYTHIGDGNGQLTYSATTTHKTLVIFGTDTTVRFESNEDFIPVQVSEYEFNNVTANGTNMSGHNFYLNVADSLEISTTPATLSEIMNAFANGKPVYRDCGLKHITGGMVSEETFIFMQSILDSTLAENGVQEPTAIAFFHQNLIPHFEIEDDWLSNYTLFNWEYTAKRFAELGIRYSFSGHQHCSDIATYTDASGKTVYDMETGSFVSLDSPIRIFEVERYSVEDSLAEKASSSLYLMDSFDDEYPLMKTPSSNVFSASPWNESAYQTAITAYNNASDSDKHVAWQAVVDANPDYVVYSLMHDDMSSLSYNEYVIKHVYSQLIPMVISHFLEEERLIETVNGILGQYLGEGSASLDEMVKSVLNVNVPLGLDDMKPTLLKVANYLVDTVFYQLYPDTDGNGYGDYVHNGKTYDNIVEWLDSVANSIIGIKFGDEKIGKLSLAEIAIYIFSTTCSGNEFTSSLEDPKSGVISSDSHYFTANSPYDPAQRAQFKAALEDLKKQCDSGEIIKRLLDEAFEPLLLGDNALLPTLLNYKFDFSSDRCGLTEDEFAWFDSLISFLGMMLSDASESGTLTISASNFVLADIINGALPMASPIIEEMLGFAIETTDILSFIEEFIGDYLVDSFYVGIGGIAESVVFGYALDDTPDLADVNDPTKPYTLMPYEGYATLSTDDGEVAVSYVTHVASKNEMNPATMENGRVPGSLTANFDTVSGTDTFKISFYTAEDVFAKVEMRKVGESNWTTVYGEHWNIFDEAERSAFYDDNNNLYAVVKQGNITLETYTSVQYIPLIDLGLACLDHSAITYTNSAGEEVYISAKDRFNINNKSVFYWNRHIVTFEGLEENATYEYRIYGEYYDTVGNNAIEFLHDDGNGEAKTFTFTTAKSSGDFEFLAISDPQGMIQSMYDETKSAFDVINGSNKVNGYDFIINAGDMVDAGSNFYQWQYALNTMIDTYANTSMFFASGNHEAGTFAMGKYFAYTQPETVDRNGYGEAMQDYYSFDYGDAHFIFLDTNDATAKSGLGQKQYDWLVADLDATTKDIVFVVMHKSLYSTGSHANDKEVSAMRAQLVPLFTKHEVDIVFGGHDHVYAEAVVDGTLYVTLGTIGTKFYEYTNDNDDVKSALDKKNSIMSTLTEQTVGHVEVKGGKVYYRGYTISELAKEDNTVTVIVGSVIGILVGGGAIAAGVVMIIKKKKQDGAEDIEAEDADSVIDCNDSVDTTDGDLTNAEPTATGVEPEKAENAVETAKITDETPVEENTTTTETDETAE